LFLVCFFRILSYNKGSYEEFYLLEQKILTNTALLATYFMLVPCLVYSSTLKMEVTYSFEMSVGFHGVIFKKR
jgi:hypothetical protein